MRGRILAGSTTPYTTADVARTLQVTDEGVRFLVREEQLACRTTPAGWRVFREADVLELAADRDKRRLRGVKVLRPKKIGPRGEPRQLALFGLRRVK